jgi:hypothetical protein
VIMVGNPLCMNGCPSRQHHDQQHHPVAHIACAICLVCLTHDVQPACQHQRPACILPVHPASRWETVCGTVPPGALRYVWANALTTIWNSFTQASQIALS